MENIWKFGQKCGNIKNTLKRGRGLHAIIAYNKLLEKGVDIDFEHVKANWNITIEKTGVQIRSRNFLQFHFTCQAKLNQINWDKNLFILQISLIWKNHLEVNLTPL